MVQASRFWDRIADRYARRPVADEKAYQEKLRLTRDRLNPEMEVLEIGCGTGSTAIAHAPYVKHIRAIDISGKMIEIARRKADLAGITNVSFEQCEIAQFDMADRALDMVMAHSILHLLENWLEVIDQVYRTLRPGGVFVSSTSCIGDSMAWFRYVAPIGQRLGIMPRVEIFTADDLLEAIRNAGFEIDLQWRPNRDAAVFILATRPDAPGEKAAG